MKRKINLLIKETILLFLVAFLFIGCSKEKTEQKNLQEIQKKNGYPVATETVKLKHFEKNLRFYGKFQGEKETIVGAMIGGRIDKIYYKPGDFVKKGEIIIEFPEDSPASKFQQAKVAYENSKKNYERMKALYDKRQISESQFDGIKTKYLVDKRNFEIMKDMLKLDAPYDGTITELYVNEGDNIKAKKPLFTIAKLNRMRIRIWISEKERMQLKKGMKVIASVEGKKFEGRISNISISKNPMKQAFYAEILFDNKNREILPGMTANLKVILYENNSAITVPSNLIKNENGNYYVFVAEGNKAKKRFVKIKNFNGVDYEISEGLNEGEKLIVKGNARINDGVKIRIVN